MPVSRIIPPHAVDRPELLARLDVGRNAPLTLVVAPAGSGKSVLLTQWAATLGDARVAWLDVSAPDSDAVHFARRLLAELGSLDPILADLGAPLGTAGGGLGDGLLETLAAALAEVPGKVVVIFDDLHRISNTEVVTDLWRLVDLLPSNTHFVFSSRVDLKLGWSRHRLQHGLVELRQAQLAFDTESAGRVLERILHRPVDRATAATIVARTEGWAAGIQLTGLSLRFRTDADQLVDALAESDRLVDRLPQRGGARRADAEAAAALCSSCRPSMRSVPAWSRTSRASTTAPRSCRSSRTTPCSSSRWPASRIGTASTTSSAISCDIACGPPTRARSPSSSPPPRSGTPPRATSPTAIECLLGAKRWNRALNLILSRGREVYERGETATVARWLSLVPADVRSARVDAELLYGILEGMSGRAAKAEEILRGVLADPALALGPQLVARAYLAACVQFRPHPEIYLEEGIRMLRAAEGMDDGERPRPHPHDGSPDDLRSRHGVDRTGALLPRRYRGGRHLVAADARGPRVLVWPLPRTRAGKPRPGRGMAGTTRPRRRTRRRGARAGTRTPASEPPRPRRCLSRSCARRHPARRTGGRGLRAPRGARPRVIERPRAADVDRARRVPSHRP